MNIKQLATTLAAGLADCDWNPGALESHLEHRLPPKPRVATDLTRALIDNFPRPYAPAPWQIATFLPMHPGFARLHRACRKQRHWPDPVIAPPAMRPLPPFARLGLPQLSTPGHLADWLMLSDDQLARFSDPFGMHNHDDETPVNHYFWHLHPKRAGGVRLIEAPKPVLKSLQRRILHDLLARVPVHEAAFGFVQGRNCLQSAQRHCGEELVISFDLRDFFPSVPAARIHALFRCLGYPHATARALTNLTTLSTPPRILDRLPAGTRALYQARHLPQGAPTSPMLANLCAFRLDRRLAGLARRLEAHYSRYADDLTFSGDAEVARAILKTVPEIVPGEGFSLNPAKTRVMRAGTRQVVTGLVVNETLGTGRKEFDRLKAVLHHCAKQSDRRLDDPGFRAEMNGRIAWVEQVSPGRGLRLRQRFEAALAS